MDNDSGAGFRPEQFSGALGQHPLDFLNGAR